MSRHLTLAMLHAKTRGDLTPEQERHVVEHLSRCPQCSELQGTLKLLRRSPWPHEDRPAQALSACPEVETLANYYNGRYSFFRRQKIQKHIAACDSCREMLVELTRLETATLPEEEHAFLETLSHSRTAEHQPQRLSPHRKSLSLAAKPLRGLQIGWETVKSFFAHHPAPAYSLASVGLLLIVALIVAWPLVQDWRSNNFARQGLQQLTHAYEIPLEQLRPAGPFQPQLLSSSVRSSMIPFSTGNSAKKFQQSLEWNADNRTALRGQALAKYFAGEREAAERILAALHARFPQEAEIVNDLGVVTAQLRTPEKALYYFDLAIRLQPDFPAARYNRAHLLQQLNQPTEAQKAWQSYLDLHEGNDWQRLAEQQRDKLR